MAMSIVKHALEEFKFAGWLKEDGTYGDEIQEMVCSNVLELLEVFSNQGHSGSSAPYVLRIFKELASFKTITPIYGTDEEWVEVGDNMFQNKRLSTIFKEGKDGTAYNIDGKIFYELHRDLESGMIYKSYFTNSDSRVDVIFPYTPCDPEYVFVSNSEFASDIS